MRDALLLTESLSTVELSLVLEGYFQAVERRGLVSAVSGGAQGTFADMSDIDSIILELDKEEPCRVRHVLEQSLLFDIDDMLAAGIATR